ncbi:MAG: 2-amino-4-hydroxy-6-hydroxymethyldihydropteridine diphosphokinase [Nitrospinae bacterium]|nr:2-amino-4-hydroxy-6-hydroxymethyldihydropteridine diphosphokinase [Nitrospinota bacterium]
MIDKARAFIGAGANLGEPVRQIRQAQDALSQNPGIVFMDASSFFRTQPMGPVEQPPFVNAVFSLECGMSPQELLALLLDIEQKMGRVRKERWGPRLIDLDLLFYDDAVIEEQGLEVPHPRLHERRFVLAPLAEIAPDFVHPVLKKPVSELLDELPPGDFWVEKLESESP